MYDLLRVPLIFLSVLSAALQRRQMELAFIELQEASHIQNDDEELLSANLPLKITVRTRSHDITFTKE